MPGRQANAEHTWGTTYWESDSSQTEERRGGTCFAFLFSKKGTKSRDAAFCAARAAAAGAVCAGGSGGSAARAYRSQVSVRAVPDRRPGVPLHELRWWTVFSAVCKVCPASGLAAHKRSLTPPIPQVPTRTWHWQLRGSSQRRRSFSSRSESASMEGSMPARVLTCPLLLGRWPSGRRSTSV